MIISASRRTDIPAFYSKWFFNRIKAGFVLVRNPVQHQQVSRIDLNPDVVDAFVFWTKNPSPMMERLKLLKDYMYYFQYTLNAYGDDIEPNIPARGMRLYKFKALSDMIGADRVIWRYDPIFFTNKYNVEYHIQSFERIAMILSGYTEKCTISFLDFCSSVQKEHLQLPSEEEQLILAKSFAEIGRRYDIQICTCAEKLCLQEFGIQKSSCIDKALLEKLIGCSLNVSKDKGQRSECGCVSSIDIGEYNTCNNGCRYCYACQSGQEVIANIRQYDSQSPLLIGNLNTNDVVKERNVESLKNPQIGFRF